MSGLISRVTTRVRTPLATLFVCLTMAAVVAGQTTAQPEGSKPQEGGKQQPQQPAPPEDSPEPLANAKPPYEALFGGASTEKETGTRVNFNGSVIEAYDQDEVEEAEPQLGGLYTSFTGDVDYTRNSSRLQFAAGGGANVRYYHQISQFLAADYRGNAGVQTDVASRTTLVFNQAVSVSPVSLPNLFATPLPPEIGEPVPPGNSNFAVTNDKFISSTTVGSLEHRFSVQSQLVVRGNYRYNHYLGEVNQNGDWSMFDSGVTYRHRLTEARSVRVGYSYRRAGYSTTFDPLTGLGAQPNEHNVFVGVAVIRSFSSSQRTTLSIDGGTSLFGVSTPTDLLQPGDKMRFVFDATVAHSIGKTWLLVGAFDRGSQFDQGYGGPVFANAFTASASGFVSTRVDLTAWLSHTDGEPIVAGTNRGFSTSTYGARMRYALSRNWALTGEYFRYNYDFTNAPPYPFLIGVPQLFARNSIRGGVVLFFPLVP